jgi:hypothetical protein
MSFSLTSNNNKKVLKMIFFNMIAGSMLDGFFPNFSGTDVMIFEIFSPKSGRLT